MPNRQRPATPRPRLACLPLGNVTRACQQPYVHPITELRQVKLQAEQFQTQNGKQLTYEEYCSLLLSAVQQYDMQCRACPDKIVKRKIYEHEIQSNTYEDEFYDAGTY